MIDLPPKALSLTQPWATLVVLGEKQACFWRHSKRVDHGSGA